MRFTLHANLDTGRGVVHDSATEKVVADTDLPRAEAISRALNGAEEARDLMFTSGGQMHYTLEGVAAYVTATDAKWSGGPCLFCDDVPCAFSTAACRGEGGGGESLPDVTLTLPGELVQALVGAEAMAAIIEAWPGATPDVPYGAVYLSASDGNEQITAALRALVAWRAGALEVVAEAERRWTDFTEQGTVSSLVFNGDAWGASLRAVLDAGTPA